jgi:hypothetical protein
MPTSEIQPSSIKIDKLLNRIEEGDIKIPAFQRAFIWDIQQILELLDSIYHDYPIGSILLWSSNVTLKSTRNLCGFAIPDRPPQYPVNYVLDGQQRLSVIYAVFCKDRTLSDEDSQFNLSADMFDIYFDLDDKQFLHRWDIKEQHINLPMNSLFDMSKFLNDIQNFDESHKLLARQLMSQFINYEIPIITITKRRKDEVGIIFERINNTGTSLTTLDLMIAWTWTEQFDLREELDSLLELLNKKGFGDTPEKIILQCLSGIVQKSTKTRDIINLSPPDVRNNISLLLESLEKSIDFLSTEFNMKSRDFLPHSHQIVPLSFFFSNVNTPNSDQIKILRQWFWTTSFSKRYSGSTDMKMNDDISFFQNVIAQNYSEIERYSYSVDPNEIIAQTFSKSNPFTRAFILLLAQKQPLNLLNGTRIDLGEALSQYNSKEYHHIFPRNFLKSLGVTAGKINSLCNICLLPSYANKVIGNKPPSDYFPNLIPKSQYASILKSNLLPPKKEIYSKNQYDEFLKQRASLIMQFLDNQIEF